MQYEEYISMSPEMTEVHYWDLPKNTSIGFRIIPRNLHLKESAVTVRILLEKFGKNKNIEKQINSIGLKRIRIKFPINLHNINYVRLYALMIAEGSTNTEFSIHVPERGSHALFRDSLINLFGKQMEKFIVCKRQRSILRSRAPRIMRFLVPTPNIIPRIILQNKRFSKEYLRIVFEAEGSPIFVGSKRYISLKRNSDISSFLDVNLDYPIEKRIYFKQFSKDYSHLAQKIKEHPDRLTLGEKFMLKNFGITTTILPECIRINKTALRCGGKISVRWDTYIYARNVNAFIEKIGFFSKSKIEKSRKMLRIVGQREQFFVLELMKKISQNNIFTTKKFVAKMKNLNYKSPRTYISRYKRLNKIKLIERGKYELLDLI